MEEGCWEATGKGRNLSGLGSIVPVHILTSKVLNALCWVVPDLEKIKTLMDVLSTPISLHGGLEHKHILHEDIEIFLNLLWTS